MNTQSKVREILQRIFDVIEEIVSLLIAGGLLIYTNLIAPSQQGYTSLVLDGILLIVGLIAISNLRDRLYRFRKIQEIIEETHQEIINKTILQSTGPDDFFTGREDSYGDFLSIATSIAISGITLSGTIQTYRAILRERLEAGSQIRIIILDPEANDALRQLVLRSWSNVATSEYYKGSLKFTSELIENIGNTTKAKGSLEIGYLPFVPSIGITILEREQAASLAFIEIYHHLTDASPGFFIDATTDPETHLNYQIQFDKMWKVCRTHKIV